MKVLAIVMVVIVVLVGAFFAYCYTGMQMQIVGVSASFTPATDALGTYDEVREQLETGAFLGTVYEENAEFLMPESFSFLTLTVRMTNRGVFPMDWIRIEVVPDAADIAQLATDRTPTLASGGQADFSTTLLTRAGASAARTVTVRYYALGRTMEVRYAMK